MIVCAAVQSGAVSVDDVPLVNANVRSLRRCIGVVSQEPRLFSTTVAKNIAMGACCLCVVALCVCARGEGGVAHMAGGSLARWWHRVSGVEGVLPTQVGPWWCARL